MSFVSILPTLLFIALGLVMFGLGLSLTVGDFKRLLQHPRAVVLALVVQLQFGKVVEVIIIVLVPVVLGMAVHRRAPAFSARMEKPMKIFSAVVLAAFALIAIAKEWTALVESFAGIGPAVLLFNAISLASGYYLSRAAGLDKSMATAISFEIGIHNSTLAIFIALSVLGNFQLALPAAIYSVSMYILAALFGGLVLRRGAQPAAAVSA